MELKRYLEADSKQALEKIRSIHGDDALIISTEKVGNKTEVIIGVEEQKDDEVTHPETTEPGFKKQLNNARVTEEPNSAKDPWKVLARMNSEIKTLKASMETMQIKVQTEHQPISLDSLDTKVNDAGFNLQAIELNGPWQNSHIFLGTPGSGKSQIIKRIALAKIENNEAKPLIISASLEGLELDYSLASFSERNNIPLMAIGLEQLAEILPKMANIFDLVLIEANTVNHITQPNFEDVDCNLTRHLCIAADSDIDYLSREPNIDYNLLNSVVLTRLDLCEDLPSKLLEMTNLNVKITGTSTGHKI
ncbi:hypothetical protein N9435_05150 [Pseudomonadales bacterium]|jgi:hypothetical protein|nr:hypothetical protein [Pseudomonadales bacterium]